MPYKIPGHVQATGSTGGQKTVFLIKEIDPRGAENKHRTYTHHSRHQPSAPLYLPPVAQKEISTHQYFQNKKWKGICFCEISQRTDKSCNCPKKWLCQKTFCE